MSIISGQGGNHTTTVNATDLDIRDLAKATDSVSAVIKDDSTGTAVSINSGGQMHVVQRGAIDSNNSSHTPLSAAATFTGTATEILDYSIVFITVYADQDSATDGLVIEQGHLDGTIHWDISDAYTIPANSGKVFAIQAASEYIRVSYTNGGSDQGTFRLHTCLKKGNSLPSSHRIQDAIIDDDDATLQKAVLTAKKDSGTFVNIGSTNSGNLRVTDAESGLAIAKGDVTNTTFIHKFGNAPDFDQGDGHVPIWDGANDGGVDIMTYTYSTSADIDSIVSTTAGDTMDIEIQGLDSNYALTTQTVTLTGQTRVALSTSLIRVFRMKNVGSTNTAGTISCYVNSAAPAGVVTDKTKVRAVILDGNNQTLMAIYTIPAGKTGYMRDWYASTSGASRSSNYVIHLFARPFGQVFQLKHVSAISDTGTSYIQHQYSEPEVFTEKTDIYISAEMTASGGTAASVSAGFDIVLVDN